MKGSEKTTYSRAFALFGRALKLLRRECPGLLPFALGSALVCALAVCPEIYLWTRLVNALLGKERPEVLAILGGGAVFVGAAAGLLRAVLSQGNHARQEGFYYELQRIYAGKRLSMELGLWNTEETERLRSKTAQDEQWYGWGLRRVPLYLETIIRGVFAAAGGAVLTAPLAALTVGGGGADFWSRPILAVVLLLLLLCVLALAGQGMRLLLKTAEETKTGNRFFGYFGFLANDAGRAMDMRIYRQQEICGHYMEMERRNITRSGAARSARGSMGFVCSASAAVSCAFAGLICVLACQKAWEGAVPAGSILQYTWGGVMLAKGISDLAEGIKGVKDNSCYLETLFAFLDLPNHMYRGSLTTEKRRDRKYLIEFRDVSFRYPGAKEDALSHVSLRLEIGKRLAVVGKNGSGKTTFIKLLCRLYEPTGGEIRLNGIDIRKYRYEDYKKLFSVVFQDFALLPRPLEENVAAGCAYDPERVGDCLEKSGFPERPDSFPKGMNASLSGGFDGKEEGLSRGEAQKVAIARALYQDAAFLVLDEPTAALDPAAEAEIYGRLDEIVQDRTAVYISHRLSSCRFCEEILVFDNGKIAQRGSHEELLADREGTYFQLWSAQAGYYRREK